MLEHNVTIILGLLVVVAALVSLSRRMTVPYPILLVLGGLALALIPGLPSIQLDPALVFLLFLPPLLYWESLTSSLRDFRENIRSISLLAIGLVLLTTCVVAWVAHQIIPGLLWPGAFVLGAVLAPTDEVAVTEVAQRLSIPRRVLTVLEGESLVNDGVSLVAYRMAITAAVTGQFSLGAAGVQFVTVSAGGVAVGLAVGWAVSWIRRSLKDPPVENTISLLSPFAAYLPAEALHTSGVLAVIATGLYLSQVGPKIVSSRTRLQAAAMWDMLTFLLNGLLFILTGLQLRQVWGSLPGRSIGAVLEYSAILTVALIVLRFLWVFPNSYLPSLFSRTRPRLPSWKTLVLVSWTGIRGGISLVTALAIPLTLSQGRPFPDRNLLIAVSFCVILTTLLLEGLTLPWLVRNLKLIDDGGEEKEEAKARLAAARAGLAHLEAITEKHAHTDHPPDPELAEATRDLIDDLREHYTARVERFAARVEGDGEERHEAKADKLRKIRRKLLQAERQTVIRLRDEGTISDDVLRRVQSDLDLDEMQLEPD